MKQENLEKFFYPMLVTEKQGKEDNSETFVRRWAFFRHLSSEKKAILLSDELPLIIKQISERNNFSEEKTEEFSRVIREIFFGTILPTEEVLISRLKLETEKVNLILREIKEKILNLKITKEKERRNFLQEIIFLPLIQAIQKYPAIYEQLITHNPIYFGISNEPQRPTLRNWMFDYRQKMGEDRNLEKRNRYLFQDRNTHQLYDEERKKLSFIFKSLDEGVNISVDSKKQEIVFPEFKKENFSLLNNYREPKNNFLSTETRGNLNFFNQDKTTEFKKREFVAKEQQKTDFSQLKTEKKEEAEIKKEERGRYFIETKNIHPEKISFSSGQRFSFEEKENVLEEKKEQEKKGVLLGEIKTKEKNFFPQKNNKKKETKTKSNNYFSRIIHPFNS